MQCKSKKKKIKLASASQLTACHCDISAAEKVIADRCPAALVPVPPLPIIVHKSISWRTFLTVCLCMKGNAWEPELPHDKTRCDEKGIVFKYCATVTTYKTSRRPLITPSTAATAAETTPPRPYNRMSGGGVCVTFAKGVGGLGAVQDVAQLPPAKWLSQTHEPSYCGAPFPLHVLSRVNAQNGPAASGSAHGRQYCHVPRVRALGHPPQVRYWSSAWPQLADAPQSPRQDCRWVSLPLQKRLSTFTLARDALLAAVPNNLLIVVARPVHPSCLHATAWGTKKQKVVNFFIPSITRAGTTTYTQKKIRPYITWGLEYFTTDNGYETCFGRDPRHQRYWDPVAKPYLESRCCLQSHF